MLKAKELRAKAWNSLKGKYFIAVVASIISGILVSISEVVASYAAEIMNINKVATEGGVQLDTTMQLGALVIVFMSLAVFFISVVLSIFVQGPAQVGECKYFIGNTDGKPSVAEVFAGFKTSYGRNIKTSFFMNIKLILWTMLFVIPGVIKAFEYAIIPYILADDPEISTKDAFKKAKEMMTGNKWRLFVLNFSFIGWILLCAVVGVAAAFIHPVVTVVLSFIAGFALAPYMNAANAEFYVELKNK